MRPLTFPQVCWECQQRISDQEAHVEDAIKEAEIEENYHRKGTSVSLRIRTFAIDKINPPGVQPRWNRIVSSVCKQEILQRYRK
jgi:hypothetical protein